MHKILLISDTHGNLDRVNELASHTNADFVIHAGDFGFYDDESVKRLSPRELRLLITHSPYRNQYDVDKQTDPKIFIEIVKKHRLLGDFPDYLSGEKHFNVPVYAILGNHEDHHVLKMLRQDLQIKNLNILDETSFYEFRNDQQFEFSLYGLGGNFLPNRKLFDIPIAGRGGKVWSTLHQFGVLYNTVKHKGKPSIFVSHVSPGKEPLLTRMMIHFMPNLWLSGHMGAPFTCVWNQFTIREMHESLEWFEAEIDQVVEEQIKLDRTTDEALLAYELIKKQIPRKEFWFKKMWNINLADAKDGYAVLNYDQGRFSLETYSRGVFFPTQTH